MWKLRYQDGGQGTCEGFTHRWRSPQAQSTFATGPCSGGLPELDPSPGKIGKRLTSRISRWRRDINDLALRELHSAHNISLGGHGSAILKMLNVADVGFRSVRHRDDSILSLSHWGVPDRGGKTAVYIQMPRMPPRIPSQSILAY